MRKQEKLVIAIAEMVEQCKQLGFFERSSGHQLKKQCLEYGIEILKRELNILCPVCDKWDIECGCISDKLENRNINEEITRGLK